MIKTDRLLLLKPEITDLEIYFKINNKPENNMFNPAGPMESISVAEISFDKLLNHWKEYGFGQWKILTQEKNAIIGFGGLSFKQYDNENKLNLGYRIDKKYWGKGYATEVARYSIHHGLKCLEKDEIYGLVRPDHKASIRVLEKCGMTLFGELDDVPGEAKSIIYRVKITG